MRVMPTNHASAHRLADEYGHDLVGHLYSPRGFRHPNGLAFALDNGCFTSWDEDEYLGMCDRVANLGLGPLWQLVPDAVANRDATLSMWDRWAVRLRRLYHWPLAFAVQDGMAPGDVPREAAVVFVGGSTRWKWATAADWCARFPRVHVARVNMERRLWQCLAMGAESVDGTRLAAGDAGQRAGFVNYLRRMRDGEGPCPTIERPDLWGRPSYDRGVA